MSGKYRTYLGRAAAGLKHVLFLAFGFVFSLNVAPLFALPYSNPLNISNFYSLQHFSPETNFSRVLLVVMGTIGIYFLLRRLEMAKRGAWFKAVVVAFVLGNFFLVRQLPPVVGGVLDIFHSGEQLAPTMAFIQGKELFSQIFFFHGLGDDVLMPVAGFKLFGRSIGAYLVFGALQQLLAAIGFFALLGWLVRGRIAFMVIALLIYASDFVDIWYIRDFGVWASLAIVYILLTRSLTQRWRAGLMTALGVLAVSACLFSVDRGLLLIGLDGLVAMTVLLLSRDKNGLFRHDWRRAWRSGLPDTAWMVGGGLAVLAAAWVWLGSHNFGEFLRVSFIDLPRMKGLISEYPLPGIGTAYGFKVWVPVVALILITLILIELMRRDWRKLTGALLYAIVLVVFAAAFLRSGVGRSDLGHVAYASTPLLLAGIWVIKLAWASRLPLWPTEASVGLVTPVALLAVILISANQTDFKRLATVPEYRRGDLRQYLRMHNVNDDFWISPEVKQTKDYILANSSKKDGLFVFTSSPIFYYLTERPNPTRFYISWFIDPQPYTDEALKDLKAHPPKLIVYKDGVHDAMDRVSSSERTPEVDRWILENYKPAKTIGKTEIFERAGTVAPQG